MLPAGVDLSTFLIAAVMSANFDFVEEALQAGASVDGRPGQFLPPIVAATRADQAGMVEFLLDQGADPDRPVTTEIPASSSMAPTTPGERALHIAAKSGDIGIVRLLLERARADPNATNDEGCTPLMTTCSCARVRVEVVWLLLEAGADPALAAEEGHIPLHSVARNGHIDLVDMLYSRAPATLNCYASNGQTPLFWACGKGHESMVSKLLTLGAMQRAPLDIDDNEMCPLLAAIDKGFVGVVQVLINKGGIRAVGGEKRLFYALRMAVCCRQPRILRLLLAAGGEETRSEWVTYFKSKRLLHCSAGYCATAVSILLEAGADEAARNSEGRISLEVIGAGLGRDGLAEMGRGEKIAIRRMLQRGPAYRARSWAWPSDEQADASGRGDRDTAAAAAAGGGVLSCPPAVKTPPVIGSKIFRPKEKSSSKFFVRLVGRYCAKD